MVELFEGDERRFERQSSKGNQLKWENEGVWYKADATGYEGLAESVVSHLLKFSSLNENEYVLYEPEEIKYKTTVYNGARSNDFLKKGWQIITLERLFKNFYNESLYKSIYKINDVIERLKFLTEQVIRITGLKEFEIYISKMLTIDAFFLNEDRHTHNIAVLMNGNGEFDYCPLFDQGASLLSDTHFYYPSGGDVYLMMEESKAKTICRSYREQLDAAEELYEYNLKFMFSMKDVQNILKGITIYPEAEKRRVENIIGIQMQRYKYLFG